VISASAPILVALVVAWLWHPLPPLTQNESARVTTAASVDASGVGPASASDIVDAVHRAPAGRSQLDRIVLTVAPDSSFFDDTSFSTFELGTSAPFDPDLVRLSSRNLIRSPLVPRSRPTPSLRS
jgi:hypothetical protein